MDVKVVEREIAGRKLIIETGKVAKQANGSVVVRYGDTMVLVTACCTEEPIEGIDFFPLTVEYRERAYAAGKIPGGFIKREGKPMENEILVSRLIDRPIRDTFSMFEDIPKPTIAAINGYAFGGGLEMALACDIRIASENAIMGLTETSLAIIPGAGGTQRLPRIVGKAWAKELIFTARRITAKEALNIGLITHMVAKEDLLKEALKIAEEISANGPIAVAQAKFAINRGTEVDIKTGLEIESKAYEVVIPTKDRVEALKAFKEKRKPKFTGE